MTHNIEPSTRQESGEESGMQISVKRGIEAWFDVDGITIHFWGSAWTGRETVTVRNGDGEQVVSDKRNLSSMRSEHQFDHGEHRYRIEFTGKLGKADIKLYRDDELVDSDEVRDNSLPLNPETGRLDWPAALKKLAPIVLIGAAVGAVVGFFAAQLTT